MTFFQRYTYFPIIRTYLLMLEHSDKNVISLEMLYIPFYLVCGSWHCIRDMSNCFFFSSPGHRPCELLSWVSVRRPSVRPSVSFSHLNLLLWNRWTEISQTCQKCSLDGPLPDLCFWCWFEIQHGCQVP